MLDEEMRYFLEYCRISGFSEKSIESLTTRLNEFNISLTRTGPDFYGSRLLR